MLRMFTVSGSVCLCQVVLWNEGPVLLFMELRSACLCVKLQQDVMLYQPDLVSGSPGSLWLQEHEN